MANAQLGLPALSEARTSAAEDFTSAVTVSQRQPRRLRAGLVWVVAGRSLGIAVTMLVNVAVARTLSPGEFGEFLVISSVLGFASLLAMMGMNSAVVRFVSESLGRGDVGEARHALRLVTRAALVGIVGIGGLTALVLVSLDTTILGLTAIAGLVPMIVVGLMLLATLQFLAEACRSLHELRMASLLSGGQTGGLLSNMLFLVFIAATMVVVRPGLFAAVAMNLCAMAITVPIAAVAFWRIARGRLGVVPTENGAPASTLTVRKLLAFSLPMLLVQLLTSATTQGDLWIAGASCSHDELALYGAARRITLLIAMPLQMLNFTVIASIGEMYSQRRIADLERLLRGAAALAAWISLAAGLVLILFGGPTMELLFGEYFRQAAPLLSILVVGQLCLVLAGSCDCALAMTGNQYASLLINLVSGVALVLVGLWAARNYGAMGLAYASAGVVAVQSVSMWLLTKKLIGVWTHPALRPSLP